MVLQKCNFCGKDESHVNKLIRSPDSVALICNECVSVCSEMIDVELKAANKENTIVFTTERELPKPKEIYEKLNQYIIGQEGAKKLLSVAVYNHYKRLKHFTKSKNENLNDVEISKSNVLVIGPTGSGKTLLAQTLARFLGVPLAIADATTLTQAGYVGDDVENILTRLIQNADGDIKKAERGIIYVDEIDKISRSSSSPSITRDVSGEGVQQALLKIIEGTVSSVPLKGGRKHPNGDNVMIDTSQILFICGGAFSDLDKVIARRMDTSSIGFNAKVEKPTDKAKNEILRQVETDDLIRYGLIAEFVGRLPVIAVLEELDKESLLKILVEPKNALSKQYAKLFAMDDVELEFTEDALSEIAELAIKRKTGARGLRGIVEDLLTDIMFEVPTAEKKPKKIVITKEDVLASFNKYK